MTCQVRNVYFREYGKSHVIGDAGESCSALCFIPAYVTISTGNFPSRCSKEQASEYAVLAVMDQILVILSRRALITKIPITSLLSAHRSVSHPWTDTDSCCLQNVLALAVLSGSLLHSSSSIAGRAPVIFEYDAIPDDRLNRSDICVCYRPPLNLQYHFHASNRSIEFFGSSAGYAAFIGF